jgi:hypothetical protein
MKDGLKPNSGEEKFYFFIHLIAIILAWFGPFLFSWKIIIPVYFLVIAQFIIFKSCLMNKHHGLDEREGHTFYSELFELMGFQPNRRKLKMFIRRYLHFILAMITLLWQVILGFEPLLF